jgi:hypothetical protein
MFKDMLTREQKKKFNAILEELGSTLDISQTEFDAAVQSYQAVGKHLSDANSSLSPYNPEILPQGSFLLGTTIKPINKTDDLDIDLVVQLKGKPVSWTQTTLKQKVGDQLKSHKTYKELLVSPDGTRCWTLRYRDNAEFGRYHMDILPAIVDSDYRLILEKAFSDTEISELDRLAIRITDKSRLDFTTEQNHQNWLKSNPFGYAKWFFTRAAIGATKTFSLREAIKPVPTFQKDKLPLQRVVQILKRHRDMMFSSRPDKDDKPVSIIITTLASKAYNGEIDIIEEYNPVSGKKMKWVGNPVNTGENFADKWILYPKRQSNFYEWLEQVKRDLSKAASISDNKLIMESLEKPFGKDAIQKAIANLDNRMLLTSTTTLSASTTKGLATELPTKLPQTKREGFQ